MRGTVLALVFVKAMQTCRCLKTWGYKRTLRVDGRARKEGGDGGVCCCLVRKLRCAFLLNTWVQLDVVVLPLLCTLVSLCDLRPSPWSEAGYFANLVSHVFIRIHQTTAQHSPPFQSHSVSNGAESHQDMVDCAAPPLCPVFWLDPRCSQDIVRASFCCFSHSRRGTTKLAP